MRVTKKGGGGEGNEGELAWCMKDIGEIVEFVVDNGYVTRRDGVWKQVRGFGMGLQCAPQLANLACYAVEREFAQAQAVEAVRHNYRYIDDILSLSGVIPWSSMAWSTKRRRKEVGSWIDLAGGKGWCEV